MQNLPEQVFSPLRLEPLVAEIKQRSRGKTIFSARPVKGLVLMNSVLMEFGESIPYEAR
jgi:hypothetical protein